ncbi:MAG TPA: GNAT family N-acetyltransferase [Candidatus Angelobacter sp.]|nr:GNAT family N-acetyltransferase [Candidatus Angelobacter sp.]
MPDVTYRKATAKDFPEILGLIRGSVDNLLKDHGFFESSPFASTKQAPIPQTCFPWFEMEIREDSEGFWVAEVQGKVAGMTLSWARGPLWYLAHLFVSPAYQGLDIGRNLMEKAMKHHGNTSITNRALVTFAYNPVSISLYARNGMYPREPLYYMECPSSQVKKEADNKLTHERITDFQKARSIITSIDKVTTGYPREKNHKFIFSLQTVQFHLFSQGREPVGYAYVWQNGRIGPLAATSASTFQDTLVSAFNIARGNGAASVGMLAAGSNDKLMEVALEQKMRILDNWLLMSAKPFANFSNYVIYPTGAIL